MKLTPENFDALTDLFRHALDVAVRNSELNRTCLGCGNFNEAAEVCALASCRPPARIIVAGCPAFVADLPF